jgi:hypothetical protein
MKGKFLRLIILSVFSALATLFAAQWVAGNIAIQVGGSNNKIEQGINSVLK